MHSRTHLATVEEFLTQHRIALIGLSREDRHFSHAVLEALEKHGHEVVPIHPTATAIAGRTCWPRLGPLTGPVDGALFMTPALRTAGAVREALAAGVPRVWLYRGIGEGAVSEEAVEMCEDAGVPVVAGECPLMFMEEPAWYDRLHGWGKHVAGSYPN